MIKSLKPILALLILSLYGCATTRKTEFIEPPSVLLEDCNIPKIEGDAVNDLMLYSLELQKEIQICNTHKEALRAFYKKLREG